MKKLKEFILSLEAVELVLIVYCLIQPMLFFSCKDKLDYTVIFTVFWVMFCTTISLLILTRKLKDSYRDLELSTREVKDIYKDLCEKTKEAYAYSGKYIDFLQDTYFTPEIKQAVENIKELKKKDDDLT